MPSPSTGLAVEPILRAGIFFGMLALMAVWEAIAPRRHQPQHRWRRWPGNLGIAMLNSVLVRLIVPAGAVGVAIIAASRGWGLFNSVELPAWVALTGAVLLLDLAIYVQHWTFHAVPLLWRLHRMHHADTALDVSSGARFHPAEILLSMAIKSVVVVAIGASPLAVLIFEVLLNASSMFNHGNIAIPLPVDRVLRWLVVTPDMHRVHHSILREETDSNFGFNLPWWDRVFGTYRAQPEAGHAEMTLGLPSFRTPAETRLDRMLLQPWRADTTP